MVCLVASCGSVTRKRVEIAVEHLEFFCHHDHFLEGFLKLVSKEMLHNHNYRAPCGTPDFLFRSDVMI